MPKHKQPLVKPRRSCNRPTPLPQRVPRILMSICSTWPRRIWTRAFDFAHQLARVTSPTQFFELSAAHARKQLETLTEQTQQLTTLAQKVTTGAAQPWTGIGKTFNQSS